MSDQPLIDYTLIPFYGGLARDTNPHGGPDKKEEWLRLTLENLRPISKRVIVGVCAAGDKELVGKYVGEDDLVFFPDINPLHLPANFMRFMQPRVTGIVMFTEADNRLYFRKTPLAEHVRVIEEDRSRYVTPHVWNPTDQTKVCHHVAYCTLWPGTEELWGVSNSIPQTLQHRDQHRFLEKYYQVPDTLGWQSIVESGGCTYICHSDLFKQIPYKDWNTDPLEYTAIIEIFWKGTCLKTYYMNDFIREHFSGGPPHVARCSNVPIRPDMVVKEPQD